MKISRPVSLSVWVLWHCVGAFTAILIPSQLRTGKSFWLLDGDHVTFLTAIAATYLVGMVVVTWRMRTRETISLTELVGTLLAVFGVYFLSLLVFEAFYSRSLLVGALFLGAVFIVLSFTLKAPAQKTGAVLIAVATMLMQATGPRPHELMNQLLGLGPKPHVSKRVVNTLLYSIQASTFSHYFDVCPEDSGPCRKPGTGGGISTFGNGYLVSTGEGRLYYVAPDAERDTLQTEPFDSRVPINSEKYVGDVGEDRLNTFRVTDILVENREQSFVLFVAHHYWKSEQDCGVLRVSKAEGEYTSVLAGDTRLDWQTVYDTTPCLPTDGGHLAPGSESGGRMAFLDDGRILLTVGDHGFDGLNRTPNMGQDEEVDYGKTVLIDPETGDAEMYTLGHRNPQGLYVSPDGKIWATEHGPRGGDELNILSRGTNYGWPLVTHGTQYGMHIWPLSTDQGRHDGFKLPVFAWVPSIAVSNLVGIERELFPLWKGDLLIASFKKTLYRARIRDGRVIYLESIRIPGRIRDLIEDNEGGIVLYMDSGALIFLEPIGEEYGIKYGKKEITEDMRGELLFANCSGCHQLGDGSAHGIGPDLSNVVGRPIAGAKGYNYSSALANLSGNWTESRLDAFLADPQQFAPGTTMAFPGMSEPADREALIRYLSEL